MRSMKLLVATALVAALVAGPVLAQEAGSMAPATTTTKATVKKHSAKKHHAAKKTTTAPVAAPAAQ